MVYTCRQSREEDMTRNTIRHSMLILFTLYLGTSVWMFGDGRFRQQTRRVVGRHHVRAFSFTRGPHQNFNRAHRRLHHRLLPLHTRLHHQVFRLHRPSQFRRGPIRHVQFSKRRPRNVPVGFKAVRISSQRVKSGGKSTFFAGRWAVIQSDGKSISPSELAPVQVSGQWTLRWRNAPQ